MIIKKMGLDRKENLTSTTLTSGSYDAELLINALKKLQDSRRSPRSPRSPRRPRPS